MTTREKYREMVIYLLKCDYVDDDEVIDSYTDSLMLGVDELEQEIKGLKDLLNKSHNRGLTSDKHNKEVKQLLNKD